MARLTILRLSTSHTNLIQNRCNIFTMKSIKFIFFLIITVSYSQNKNVFEDEYIKLWNKELPLSFDDFNGNLDKNPKVKIYADSTGRHLISTIEIYKVIDVYSNKKKEWKPDVIYLCPSFEKANSFLIQKDKDLLKNQQLIFDYAELTCRRIRNDLKDIADEQTSTIGKNTAQTLMLNHVFVEYYNEFIQTKKAFIKEYYESNNKEAYNLMRKVINEELEKTTELATRINDCKRFYLDKPIKKEYVRK